MKLKRLLFLSVIFAMSSPDTRAQVTDTSAQWIWKNGLNGTSRYQIDGEKRGTLGQPYAIVAPPTTLAAMNNWPGSKSESVTWTDTLGRFYIFGGAFNGQNSFNQVWRFNPDSSTWAWMHGRGGYSSRTDFGVLVSAAGVPHPDNMPDSRYSAAYAVDSAGCVWVFGGYENSTIKTKRNDFWKYNPYENEWTYFTGNTTYRPAPSYGSPVVYGTYGTKGVAASGNQPGVRGGGNGAAWIDDKAGKFYMFGGIGVAGPGSADGYLTDFWSYDMATGMWTWIGGGDSISTSLIANYGTKGVAAATNFPQPRQRPITWKDDEGNFWMQGGIARIGTVNYTLNDLWKYDPSAGMWTWVSGDKIDLSAAVLNSAGSWAGHLGVFGQRGVPDAANKPGSKYGGGAWVDVDGKFWIFAGRGLAESLVEHVPQNDVWRYDPVTDEWTWMFGDKTGVAIMQGTPGNYIAGAGATPGGRYSVSTWVDGDGNFWTFGGNGGGTTNEPATRSDLWKLEVIVPPVQPGLFTTAKPNVCHGESNVTYTVPAVADATSYNWEYNGTNVTFNSTTTTPTNSLSFAANATGGTLRVRGVNIAGNGPWRDTTIIVNPLPTVTSTNIGNQAVCAGDSLLLTATASSGVSYQWKRGTTNVGTNSATYYAKVAGSYTVTVTNTTTNCSAASTPTTLAVTPLPNISISPATVTICAGESATLTASGASTYSWSPSGGNSATATVSPTTATTYTVTGTASGCSNTASRQVTVNALPTVTSTNTGSQSVCDGDSLLLTASGSSSVSYQWQQGTTNVGTGATYYAKTAGTYTVTATNTTTNCSATSDPATTLTINPLPVATVTIGGPTEVCTGATVDLTASPVTGADYQWKHDGANTGTNSNTYAASATGVYKVVVTYAVTGCTDSSSAVDVSVYDRPVVTLVPGDTAFCDGGLVRLEVESLDTGLTYLWKDGSTTIPLASAYFLEITETGDYTVEVGRASVAGCDTVTNQVTVTVHPLPVVDVTWDGVTLHATPGYNDYQWYNNGQGIAGATDSTYVPESNSGYSVTVTDDNDCSKTSPVYNVTDIGLDVTDVRSVARMIQIYPNPVQSILNIQSPVRVNINLSSVDGRLLLQQANARVVDMSAYANGVYLLRITDEAGRLLRNEKIVKQH